MLQWVDTRKRSRLPPTPHPFPSTFPRPSFRFPLDHDPKDFSLSFCVSQLLAEAMVADLSAADGDGQTLAVYAAEGGHTEVLKVMRPGYSSPF